MFRALKDRYTFLVLLAYIDCTQITICGVEKDSYSRMMSNVSRNVSSIRNYMNGRSSPPFPACK